MVLQRHLLYAACRWNPYIVIFVYSCLFSFLRGYSVGQCNVVWPVVYTVCRGGAGVVGTGGRKQHSSRTTVTGVVIVGVVIIEETFLV